jgi:hypothetical protein
VNPLEIIRGIGNVLVVMIIAGAVAYVGDRVGHQVGRRRLTLFGIRPRYTSTIIAIGTGMTIALVVTLVAIFASQEVKTAFFKLNSINQQIGELQSRQRDLETKVNTGRLIVPIDVQMVPFFRIVEQSATQAQRLATIRAFYYDAVKFINATYPRLGLRAYVNPPDIEKRLADFDLTQVAAGLTEANVMLTATADQNLFENDQIHFQINGTADARDFVKGQVVAQLTIPGKSGANIPLALNQLQTYVSLNARRHGLPLFLAESVRPVQLIPGGELMQQRVNKPGTYALTAFAATDYYPHLGVLPIVIVLTQEQNP